MNSGNGHDPEYPELYARFLKCLVQVLAGPESLISLNMAAVQEHALQAQIVVQGEKAKMYLAFSGISQSDATAIFISLVRVFDQVSAQFQVQPEEVPFPLSGLRSEYMARLPDGGEMRIAVVFTGQFTDRELIGLRWYMLADQKMAARLVLFSYLEGGLMPCLQLATTGDLYQLVYQGREPDGAIRFRSGGLFQRSQHGEEIDCYFSGTINFALSSLADFLAEASLVIKLPERMPAFSSNISVRIVEVTLMPDGEFQIIENNSSGQETFLKLNRTISRNGSSHQKSSALNE